MFLRHNEPVMPRDVIFKTVSLKKIVRKEMENIIVNLFLTYRLSIRGA